MIGLSPTIPIPGLSFPISVPEPGDPVNAAWLQAAHQTHIDNLFSAIEIVQNELAVLGPSGGSPRPIAWESACVIQGGTTNITWFKDDAAAAWIQHEENGRIYFDLTLPVGVNVSAIEARVRGTHPTYGPTRPANPANMPALVFESFDVAGTLTSHAAVLDTSGGSYPSLHTITAGPGLNVVIAADRRYRVGLLGEGASNWQADSFNVTSINVVWSL